MRYGSAGKTGRTTGALFAQFKVRRELLALQRLSSGRESVRRGCGEQ